MTEAYVERHGVKVWTCLQGEGSPLLLCNGGPGCCDYLSPVAGMVDDLAQVVRFEQRGCGRSDRAGPYDLLTCIEDIEAIRGHYGIDKWIVGGHSWGANLALAYSLDHPDRAQALIYIAGNGAQHDVEWRDEYKHALSTRGEQKPEMACPGNDEVNRCGNASWYDYIRHPEFLRRSGELKIPALFVVAGDDIRPNWPAEQMSRLLPDCRLVRIEDAGHYIWLTHAAELRTILRSFLKDL